jgi:CBS-domain-containing membrane protein
MSLAISLMRKKITLQPQSKLVALILLIRNASKDTAKWTVIFELFLIDGYIAIAMRYYFQNCPAHAKHKYPLAYHQTASLWTSVF